MGGKRLKAGRYRLVAVASGFAGDSIASALAAGDQWILSRSFKYRRPRGVLTMAGQDANTLVQVESEPNVLADRRAIPSHRKRASTSRVAMDVDAKRVLGMVLERLCPVSA